MSSTPWEESGKTSLRADMARNDIGKLPTKIELIAKIAALIQEAVLPGAKDHLNKQDPMEEHLANRRVRAVLEFYAPEIREIFGSYAQADQNSAGSLTSLDTLNLNETLFMLKEGAMMDDKLTLLQVTNIFAAVNAGAEEEEDGDDDEAELCFDEFAVLLAELVGLPTIAYRSQLATKKTTEARALAGGGSAEHPADRQSVNRCAAWHGVVASQQVAQALDLQLQHVVRHDGLLLALDAVLHLQRRARVLLPGLLKPRRPDAPDDAARAAQGRGAH